jgi:hypothetical protein
VRLGLEPQLGAPAPLPELASLARLAPQLEALVQRQAAAVEAAVSAPPAEPELQGLEQPAWVRLSSRNLESVERSQTRAGKRRCDFGTWTSLLCERDDRYCTP